MKKWLKDKKKFFIGILIGMILAGTTAYAATILYQGINVGYNNSGTHFKDKNNNNVEEVQTALDELYDLKKTVPNTIFNIGDYFSLTPDKNSYTIEKKVSGYNQSQTINPSELTLWRVIDIYSDGSVDAVSEYTSSEDVIFANETGFINYIRGLQIIAAQYAKAGYTAGTRMMGYSGQTMSIKSRENVYTNVAPSTASTISPTTGIGQEYSGGLLGDTLYLKDYQLVSKVYKTDPLTYGQSGLIAYKVGTSTENDYWLASRSYIYNNNNWHFDNRYVTEYGNLNGLSMCYGDATISACPYSNMRALRPIITLNANIYISGGSGTKVDPYVVA